MQELRCILAVYLGTVIGGYSMGLSAVVIPDIVRCTTAALLEVKVMDGIQGTAVGAEGK